MDLNTRKERFSLAYINAVATYANCEVLEPLKWTEASVDGFDGKTPARRPRPDQISGQGHSNRTCNAGRPIAFSSVDTRL